MHVHKGKNPIQNVFSSLPQIAKHTDTEEQDAGLNLAVAKERGQPNAPIMGIAIIIWRRVNGATYETQSMYVPLKAKPVYRKNNQHVR